MCETRWTTAELLTGEDSRGDLRHAVDERVSHAGGDGGGLCRVAESEDALDDRQLGAGGVQAAERAPVVDHHPRRDHLTASVHRAGHEGNL